LSVIKALQLANFFNVHQVHWRDQNVSLNLPEMERAPQRQDTVSDHWKFSKSAPISRYRLSFEPRAENTLYVW
jgi:hypothetical protein